MFYLISKICPLFIPLLQGGNRNVASPLVSDQRIGKKRNGGKFVKIRRQFTCPLHPVQPGTVMVTNESIRIGRLFLQKDQLLEILLPFRNVVLSVDMKAVKCKEQEEKEPQIFHCVVLLRLKIKESAAYQR